MTVKQLRTVELLRIETKFVLATLNQEVNFVVKYILFCFYQDERKRLKNAIIIQSFIRGYQDLKRQVRSPYGKHSVFQNITFIHPHILSSSTPPRGLVLMSASDRHWWEQLSTPWMVLASACCQDSSYFSTNKAWTSTDW